jgi:hypothetical protein
LLREGGFFALFFVLFPARHWRRRCDRWLHLTFACLSVQTHDHLILLDLKWMWHVVRGSKKKAAEKRKKNENESFEKSRTNCSNIFLPLVQM